MTDELNTPRNDGLITADGVVFDFNRIKARERREFAGFMKRAEEASDDALMYPWLARIIVSWPYPGDPSKVESYEELGMAAYFAVMRAFLGSITKMVKVD